MYAGRPFFTPLFVAAAHIGRPTFNRRAFEKLLDPGADAKAVDLTWASDSGEITELLLSRNCDVLNVLISRLRHSRGGDVNGRQTRTGGEDTQIHQPTPIYIDTSAPRQEVIARTEFERHLRGDLPRPSRDGESFATPGPFVPEEEMYPLDYAAHLYARQPELDEMFEIRNANQREVHEVSHVWKLPPDELKKVIQTLVARGADVMAEF
ncbi:ankyrin repeat protein [Diaporthe eres]|nr:ankyrin repeat protein [Diaporthe eres]